MKNQNKLSKGIIQSEIRNMSIECNKIGGINLSQGFSDTPLNPIIGQGAINAINNGINHYTRYDGLLEIRKAVSQKLAKYNKIEADPDDEIIVTSGSTAALFCVLFPLCKEGDEVLLFEPYYGYHLNTILALKLQPKYCRLDAPDWKLDISKLESHISSKTRAIIINTPTNPSGKVYSKDEIIQLGRIAKKHDIFLITDEIYEYFLYDDSEHISPGSISEFKDCVITISGYSKTFSITGWRIGYIVCNKDLAKDIGFVHDLMYVCAPAPLQIGVAEGIMKLDNSFYDNLKLTYKYKRDLICDALNNAGLNPIKPQGAYYVLADISRLEGVTSKEKTMNFLRMTKIAIVPGEAFYHDSAGDNIARVCFAKDDSILKSVADILLSVKV